MDDRQIVALFEQRDTAAIREIQDAYGRQLTAIAMAVLSDPQDAEECVSDGLLRAWNAIPPINRLFWVDYTFDSLPEMVSDLGVNLLTNDRLIDHGCYYDVSATHPTEVSKETLLISVSYQPETALSNQYPAFVYARISPNTNAGGTFYADVNNDIQTTTYDLERLDVTAAIATGVYGSGSTVAYFVKDGIAYDVEIFNNSLDDMYDILNSFHY